MFSTTDDVVLDANVLVALADSEDSLAANARVLVRSIRARGAKPLLLDFLVGEARETGGRLNVHDAMLVVLQRHGMIGAVATFDEALGATPGFVRAAP